MDHGFRLELEDGDATDCRMANEETAGTSRVFERAALEMNSLCNCVDKMLKTAESGDSLAAGLVFSESIEAEKTGRRAFNHSFFEIWLNAY